MVTRAEYQSWFRGLPIAISTEQNEYEDLLCQAKDAEMAAEAAEDLRAADLLYIAQHPDEFTEA